MHGSQSYLSLSIREADVVAYIGQWEAANRLEVSFTPSLPLSLYSLP